MKSARNRPIALPSLVLVLTLLLAACGETPTPAPTQPPPTAAVSPTATAANTIVPTAVPPPTPNVTTVPTPAVTSPPGCTDQAAFVADVTFPDGTLVSPGQVFLKTWRLRNSGSCAWTTDYALVFASGDRMGGPAEAPFPTNVPPGGTVDLSVALTAPAGTGTYTGNWRLRNAQGQVFGLGPTADAFIVVVTVGLATATPTPATPVPPTVTPVLPTPLPPTATPPVYPNWRGEYFANPDLSGAPTLVRDDPAIEFSWGNGSPAPVLPSDGFSVRWTRVLTFSAGVYLFEATVDDGMRIYIDNALVLDAWAAGPTRTVTATSNVAAGPRNVRIEYFEKTGQATIAVSWNRISNFVWRGEYWANPTLSGTASLTRDDPTINFNWGTGGPGGGLPADNFSARWTVTTRFEAATYRFHAWVDDGVRLWVDDVLIIDSWLAAAPREVTADYALTAGDHRVRVEYFEATGGAEIRVWWKARPPSP